MRLITATRRLQFCAGHRVMGHESKCANLHGHNYVVLLTAKAKPQTAAQDGIGRVVDFSVLKATIGTWIDRFWDHGFILCADDQQGLAAVKMMPGQKLFVMGENPTAENMAHFILSNLGPRLLPSNVRLIQVRIWETENCYADARLPLLADAPVDVAPLGGGRPETIFPEEAAGGDFLGD